MTGINDLIRRVNEARENEPPPNDLLNAEPPCECGSPSCASPIGTPILEPGRFKSNG